MVIWGGIGMVLPVFGLLFVLAIGESEDADMRRRAR